MVEYAGAERERNTPVTTRLLKRFLERQALRQRA